MENNKFLAYLIIGFLFFGIALACITFIFAKGTAYMSDNPQACNNCHVMNETFDSWKKGNHHHVAVCNDCHVPHNFIGKWLTKAENGFHHSIAFTFGNVPSVIRARESSKQISVENCLRCHDSTLNHFNKSLHDNSNNNCLNCHKKTGHYHP